MLFKRVFLFVLITVCSGFTTDPAYLYVEGLVTIDGVPVKATIEVNSIQGSALLHGSSGQLILKGNFATKLPADGEYEIVVKVDRFPQQVISLSTFQMDSSRVLNVFADFTSPEYDRKLDELLASTKLLLNRNKTFDTKNFADLYGNRKEEQLEFKVQIGAYKFYENFNYNNVLGFPKIIRKTENDLITRFTMGSFETYNQALVLLQQLPKNELRDAFVVAAYKGERKMLYELLDEKIIR